MNKSDKERLAEIRTEMFDLLHDAKAIMRGEGGFEYERAKAYWIGHLDAALGGGDYGTKYDVTLLSTLKDLGYDEDSNSFEDEEEEEEEDEEEESDSDEDN